MLDVDRLRVFREVANSGSFSAAARTLSFTQPGVSHHIKQLERELGVALLERSSRGIRLTPPGRALLEHAEALLARLDDAERDVIEIAKQGGGKLRLVAFPTAAATVVPLAVARFRKQLPGVQLRLAEADPPASLPRLAAGDWDLALAYEYPCLRLATDPAWATSRCSPTTWRAACRPIIRSRGSGRSTSPRCLTRCSSLHTTASAATR